MGEARISKRLVDGLESTGTEYFVWDSDLLGFGVRVRETGARSYIVRYRAGSGRSAPTRRLTLGSVTKLAPDQARALAKKALAQAATGSDPVGDKARERAEMSVKELTDLYLSEGCETKRQSTLVNDRSRIARHICPLLGTRRIGSITSADVEKLMRDVAAGKTATDVKTGKQGRAIVKGGKGVAGKVVTLLAAIFNFAIARKLVTTNPAVGIKKYPENKQERFLTSDELERLGAAIREAETIGIEWNPDSTKKVKHAPKSENRRTVISPHTAAALRLLVLTGARLREILHLQWSEVDLERGLLFLPTSKTGKKTIVLNGPALSILAGLRRVGRYVVAGDTAGQADEKPRADLSKPWRLVCGRAGLEGVRLHDLRHTNASVGAAAGLGLPIIGKLLGHSQASTTQRYAHLDNDPLRRAADRIAFDIAKAMGDGPRL